MRLYRRRTTGAGIIADLIHIDIAVFAGDLDIHLQRAVAAIGTGAVAAVGIMAGAGGEDVRRSIGIGTVLRRRIYVRHDRERSKKEESPRERRNCGRDYERRGRT